MFVCNLYWREPSSTRTTSTPCSQSCVRPNYCRQVCPLNILSSSCSSFSSVPDETYTRIPSAAGISIGDHLKFDRPESPFPCRITPSRNPMHWPLSANENLSCFQRLLIAIREQQLRASTVTEWIGTYISACQVTGSICLEISQTGIRSMPVLNTEPA